MDAFCRCETERYLFTVAVLNGVDSVDIGREDDIGQFFDDGSIVNDEKDR